MGWVHRIRDMGSLVFFDLRDREGLTQVVVRDEAASAVTRLKTEMVVAVIGRVDKRSEDTRNPKLETGEVEVVLSELRILSDARRPPFQLADDGPIAEETRLRYRYLDLRRPRMQRNLILRHRVAMAMRKYFDEEGFIEVETPILTKSTPEGARDYLVPSRVHPGEFFALPQSPQIFKQILMIGGLDRYFQIVRCFRDEDLRADRQPEFTQIDVEISFARPDTVFAAIEGAMTVALREANIQVERPFPRLTYADVMARYGTDRPDTRFGLEIQDVGALFTESPFGVFREAVAKGGTVRGFVIPRAASYSRRAVDELVDQATQLGASGLVWARIGAEGVPQASVKAITEDVLRRLFEVSGSTREDLLVLAAGEGTSISKMLGQLRVTIAKREGLIRANEYRLLWVTDFPLFDWNAEERRWEPVNHPFTAPREEDIGMLESDPGRVLAKAYDLVLNGWELGSGSIRIHDAETQAKVFRLLGLSDEEARRRFGFFIEALQYGTPPHGGIALGLDRICAILTGESSIREVIAFPKTAAAVDLMAGAPSTVDSRQLKELHLKL